MVLVAGVRWASCCKDAGNPDSGDYRGDRGRGSAASSAALRHSLYFAKASLPARLELPLDLAARIAIGDGAPLVTQLLAPPDRDFRLHLAVLEVEAGRHEGEALFAHLRVEPVDLAPVQEELARPVGLVILAVARAVLRHVQADEPRLAVAHVGVRLLERRLPLPQRLHLGAGQHEAGLDPVEEAVVVPRAAVVDDQLFSHGLRHRAEV